MPKTPKTSHPNNMNFFNKSYVFTVLLLQNQRIRECLNSNHLKSMLLLRNYSYESSLLCPFSYTCSLYVHRVDDINHFFGQLYHTVSIGGRTIRILFKYILLQMSWLSYWVSKNQSFTHIKDCLSPRVKF